MTPRRSVTCSTSIRTPRTAFRRWLAEKYPSIDALNIAWNRNYQSFDEAEIPRTRNTFNDLVDWRMFFVHVLGEHVRRRFEIAEEVDAGRHPLMCHHVFLQGFPTVSTANDPWNVGQYGDLHGHTQMDDPMMSDVLRSCARGKPVISAEMLMLMGYTLDLPETISADDIKRHVFTGLAANLKGFLFWQYRPEMLGREAPTWGLAHLDGSSTPWLESFAEIGRVLQEHAGFVLDSAPRQAEVAVLYSPENQVFAWASTGNEKSATDSILGVHRALYERNHVVDLLHPKDFADGSDVLDQYRVIVVPFPYYLSGADRRAAEGLGRSGRRARRRGVLRRVGGGGGAAPHDAAGLRAARGVRRAAEERGAGERARVRRRAGRDAGHGADGRPRRDHRTRGRQRVRRVADRSTRPTGSDRSRSWRRRTCRTSRKGGRRTARSSKRRSSSRARTCWRRTATARRP